MILFTLFALLVLSLITAIRMIIGPSPWDRLLGFSQFSAKLVLIILLYETIRQQDYLLDVALTYTLLEFIGITFFSNFIRNRGRKNA